MTPVVEAVSRSVILQGGGGRPWLPAAIHCSAVHILSCTNYPARRGWETRVAGCYTLQCSAHIAHHTERHTLHIKPCSAHLTRQTAVHTSCCTVHTRTYICTLYCTPASLQDAESTCCMRIAHFVKMGDDSFQLRWQVQACVACCCCC